MEPKLSSTQWLAVSCGGCKAKALPHSPLLTVATLGSPELHDVSLLNSDVSRAQFMNGRWLNYTLLFTDITGTMELLQEYGVADFNHILPRKQQYR